MPAVFISYSHDSPDHEERVRELAGKIHALGLECRIDQFEQSPPEGWPRWMVNQILAAQYVLVVCTETYARRFEGREGLGANWEGGIITQQLYEAAMVNTKFIPVVFRKEDAAHIPILLRPAQYYDLSSGTAWDGLCRRFAKAEKPAPAPAPSTVFSVPFARNPFFAGRTAALQNLREGFETGRKLRAVSGLGGIGKTELALEYVYRYREEYRAVLWVGGETRDSLISGYAKLADALGLPERGVEQHDLVVAAVLRWLAANEGWLLVLDYVTDPDMLRDMVPGDLRGHVISTSRVKSAGMWEVTELEALEPAEAADFVARRAGRPDEPEAALRLAEALECVPLALEQAAAYIRKMDTRIADYLTSLEVRGSRLLESSRPERYARSVADAWAPNFGQIESAAPVAADLLRFSAFLAADRIPLELAVRGAPELGDRVRDALENVTADPLALDEAFQPLAEFSLIRRNRPERTYSIHRLVQDAIQRSMTAEERQRWAERTVAAVERAFPVPDFAMWPFCERLLPHALACARVISRYSIESGSAGGLLNQTALYLLQRARYTEFEPIQKLALAIWEKTLPADHPLVAAACTNLGSFYRQTGRYAEAEALLTRAKDIADGSPEPDLAMAGNNLALLYLDQGRYREAEPLLREAVDRLARALGNGHESLALPLNNLGEICRVEGRYGEARALYSRALEIWQSTRGEGSPNAAVALSNLGLLAMNQGQYPEAEALLQQAIAGVDQTVGEQHPHTATILNNLGELYRTLGRYTDAEQALKRALAIQETLYGSAHPMVGLTLGNLGLVYMMEQKYAVAEQMMKTSVGIAEEARGDAHPDLAAPLSNLGELYRRQGNMVQARALLDRALRILEAARGPEHPDLIMPLNNLALTLIADTDLAGGEQLLERALAIADRSFGAAHPEVVLPVLNLGAIAVLRKQKVDPEALFEKALGAGNPRIEDWIDKYREQLQRVEDSAEEIEAAWAEQTAGRGL